MTNKGNAIHEIKCAACAEFMTIKRYAEKALKGVGE